MGAPRFVLHQQKLAREKQIDDERSERHTAEARIVELEAQLKAANRALFAAEERIAKLEAKLKLATRKARTPAVRK